MVGFSWQTPPLCIFNSLLLFLLQSRLKEAVQLLEDYKHGTLPPGVTNKEVRGKNSHIATAGFLISAVKFLLLPALQWGG